MPVPKPEPAVDHEIPSNWRCLKDTARPGSWNMALDVALARCRAPGGGVLRIYRWSRPTLSFGRHQPARARYEPILAQHGIDAVRRPTGGREVLHDREVTYSVVAPLRSMGGLRSAYESINTALVAALRSLGIRAQVSTLAGPVPSLGSGACFAGPVRGEVEVEGRKLVGSAQVRIGPTFLQHGSLLLEPPSVRLGPGFAGISVAELLEGPVDVARIEDAIEEALAAITGGTWWHDEASASEREVASALVPQYESPTWTWRN